MHQFFRSLTTSNKIIATAQKMKFSITKSEASHLLKKSLMENFIFCLVTSFTFAQNKQSLEECYSNIFILSINKHFIIEETYEYKFIRSQAKKILQLTNARNSEPLFKNHFLEPLFLKRKNWVKIKKLGEVDRSYN